MLIPNVLARLFAFSSILALPAEAHTFKAFDIAQAMSISKEALGTVINGAASMKGTVQRADLKAMVAKVNSQNVSHVAQQARDWAKENPKTAACIGFSAVVVAAPVILTSPALAVTGFGMEGVAGSSVAAGAHSIIRKVAAGSAFSVLQSAGAGGVGLATVNGVVQGVAATVGTATGATAWLSARNNNKQQDATEVTGEESDEKTGKKPEEELKSKL